MGEEEAREDRGQATYDPLVALMERFEGARVISVGDDAFADLSPDDALIKHIVDGVKKGLDRRLEASLVERDPLSIVNDVLLEGMRRVGEEFGAGRMQLPFVLQSAEVMKTAVAYLEPKMPKNDGGHERGSILLATVAGDVHDIGKNLVDIILTNNGYRVVNIGIKQPIGTILQAAEEHRVQAIGMSGLLVKSTLIMKENLLEMNRRGLASTPVLLGGAALTRSYVEDDLAGLYEGHVFYAKDAFEGLAVMERLHEPTQTRERNLPPRRESHRTDDLPPDLYRFAGMRSDIGPVEPPPLPFHGSRTADRFDLAEIARYVNPVALFRGQWQFRRPAGMGNAEFDPWLESNARPVFDRLLRDLAPVLRPKVAWGYFPCQAEGNALVILDDAGAERLRFDFPRQSEGKRLCLADFFRSERTDVVGFSAVTMGPIIAEHERSLFERGDYQEYLYVHGMGVEMTEALAELQHRRMRAELGLDGEPATMKELFGAKYHGARFSFGYPACPRLEDQTKLFELIRPERIGIRLTEELMLEPEQATTAMIVHHPAAKYFNVR